MKSHSIVVTLSLIILISCFTTGLAFADTLWTQDGDNIYNTNSGNVGIGTANPISNLHIKSSNNAFTYLESGEGLASIIMHGNPTQGYGGGIGLFPKSPVDNRAVLFYIDGMLDNSQAGMALLNNGNVGIGTANPLSNLHIKSSGNVFTYLESGEGLASVIRHGNTGQGYGGGIGLFPKSPADNRAILFYINGIFINSQAGMVLLNNGNVGIGITNPQYKLAVNGTIAAKEVKVLDTGWSDFVFEDTYNLPSLDNVESYIKENKHLPGIPSAKEVEENGLAMSDMLAKHMQKIEELTLYLIELKKENNDLKQRVASLEKLTHKKH